MSKINEIFRASRGLRRRPQVERNIYSAAHTGVRPSTVEPESTWRQRLRTASRSIVGMRLPAIPPNQAENAVPSAPITEESAPTEGTERNSVNSLPPAPPLPLPRSVPSPTAETKSELNRTESHANDVVLPMAVVRNSTEESESDDDSDDDKEYIPKHRFSMVHANRVKAQKELNEAASDKCEANQADKTDNEQLQYVAVDVLKDEPVTGANSDKDPENKNVEVDASVDETNKTENEGANPIEYTNIDMEKTKELERKLSSKRSVHGDDVTLPEILNNKPDEEEV